MAKYYYSDAYTYVPDTGAIASATLALPNQMMAKAPSPARQGESVSVFVTFTVTAAFASTDVLYLAPIPAGAKVSRLFYTNTDLDSGTTVTHKTGLIVADDDCFEAAGTTTLRGATTTAITDAALSAAAVASGTYSSTLSTGGVDDHVCMTFGAASTATTGTISALVTYFYP